VTPSAVRLGVVTGLILEVDVLKAAAAKLRTAPPRIACHGPGQDRARKAARELIADGATHLLSFGIAAGLDPTIGVGTAIVATALRRPNAVELATDASWAACLAKALPGVQRAVIADSVDILTTVAMKAGVWSGTGALAADMESYGMAEEAKAAGLPCAVVRVVSDGAFHGIPPAAMAGANPDGTASVARVLAALLKAPEQLPALVRLGRDVGLARRRLRALADLGVARSFFAGVVDE